MPAFHDGELIYIYLLHARWNPVDPLIWPTKTMRIMVISFSQAPSSSTILGVHHSLVCLSIAFFLIITVSFQGNLHGPTIYPDPHHFDPNRFMATGAEKQHFLASDLLSVSFGYCRRSCLGPFMADAQVWDTIGARSISALR